MKSFSCVIFTEIMHSNEYFKGNNEGCGPFLRQTNSIKDPHGSSSTRIIFFSSCIWSELSFQMDRLITWTCRDTFLVLTMWSQVLKGALQTPPLAPAYPKTASPITDPFEPINDFPKPPQKTLDGSNQCVLWHMVALLIQGLVKPCSTVISQDSTTAMASTKDFEVTFSITPL